MPRARDHAAAAVDALPGWAASVVRSNVRGGRLIATMVDSGYEPFLLNWCAGLRALRLREFVVVALDRPIWSLLRQAGLQP